MFETLLIYDNRGKVYFNAVGDKDKLPVPVGLPHLKFVMPDGKKLIDAEVQVDTSVSPALPILVDVPKSDSEELREVVEEQSAALMELGEILAMILEGGGK